MHPEACKSTSQMSAYRSRQEEQLAGLPRLPCRACHRANDAVLLPYVLLCLVHAHQAEQADNRLTHMFVQLRSRHVQPAHT